MSNLQSNPPVDGWTPANESWAYASADAPTYTITVPSGAASKYSAGMRIKLTDSTVKYFIITVVADTVLTVYGGTDYTLSGGAITLPYYSTQKAPLGFSLDPTKWTVEATDTADTAQATPADSTWYNIHAFTASMPIGVWRAMYEVCVLGVGGSTQMEIQTCLSTANNSASDTAMVADSRTVYLIGQVTQIMFFHHREKTIVATTKTTYYLNERAVSSSLSNLYLASSGATGVIRFICAYL